MMDGSFLLHPTFSNCLSELHFDVIFYSKISDAPYQIFTRAAGSPSLV